MFNRSLSSSSVSAGDEDDDVKMAERGEGKCLSEDCFHSGQNHRRRRRRIKWVGIFAAFSLVVLLASLLPAVSDAATTAPTDDGVDDDVYSVVSGAAHLGRRRNSEPL